MTNATNWSDLAFDFSDAAVLVTGGTSGIGASIAAAYHKAGANVTITGTRPSANDYDEDLSAYRYLQMKLGDNAQIEAVTSKFTQLDILVNNAGGSNGPEEYKPDEFDQSVDRLLNSVYRLSCACSNLLEQSTRAGGGSIVSVSSSSSILAEDTTPAYAAAKAGLNSLTRVLAVAWAKKNIRVNAIAPALTRTRLTDFMFEQGEMIKPALARTPLQRLAVADDMAGPVLFLSSSAAGFITGQTMPVDGGFTIAGPMGLLDE